MNKLLHYSLILSVFAASSYSFGMDGDDGLLIKKKQKPIIPHLTNPGLAKPEEIVFTLVRKALIQSSFTVTYHGEKVTNVTYNVHKDGIHTAIPFDSLAQIEDEETFVAVALELRKVVQGRGDIRRHLEEQQAELRGRLE